MKKKKKRAGQRSATPPKTVLLKDGESKYDVHKDAIIARLDNGEGPSVVARAYGIPTTYLYPLLRKWGVTKSFRKPPMPRNSPEGREAEAKIAEALEAVQRGEYTIPEAEKHFGVNAASMYARRQRMRARGEWAEEGASKPTVALVPSPPPPPTHHAELVQRPGSRTAQVIQQLSFLLDEKPDKSELERQLEEVTKERDAARLALELVLDKVTGRLQ